MPSPSQILIYYEWKMLIRNRFQLLMLAVTFLFGLYAIYYGQSEINAQRQTIQAVQNLEQEEFSSYQASFAEEMEPLEHAALAIGQRDLFRYYYRLTGMSMHYQLFENELANPVNLMVGNFDLSFVLVYLFPLLIIAFCYGLFSSEKENGTLPLLMMQPVSLRRIILVRFLFYFGLITGLALLLSLNGLITSGYPLKAENLIPALAWLLGVLVYCAFWFGLLFLIISFCQSSTLNAITAVGCWLLLLIVIPAVLNVIVTVKYPLSSATLAGLTRRTGLENEDDEEESREVIQEFLTHKPELAGSDSLMKNNLLPKAYAAFTSLKDINSQQQVDQYNAQVAQRNAWTSRFHWLSPAVNMQEVLAHIAETDVSTFLRFQAALASFHGEITDFYFTRLFWDKLILQEDYASLPVFEMPKSDDRWNMVWLGLANIFLAAGGAFTFGSINMKGGARQ